VIGVGNYRSLPTVVRGKVLQDLKGPQNDVLLMKNALLSYGFEPSNIKILLDEKATKKNIWRAFNEWLIKSTKAGDEVVFYFSGHGTQVIDRDHDEEDGWDETLCPYDIDPKTGDNAIIDDELSTWLRMLKKRYVTVIIDSCYSGGATRSIGKIVVDELEPTPAVQPRHIMAIYDWNSSATTRGISQVVSDYPEDTIFLGASSEAQEAFERRIDPQHTYGSFTYSLVKTLNILKDPTYEKALNITRKEIRAKIGLAQTPVLIANKRLRKRRVFGGRGRENTEEVVASFASETIPSHDGSKPNGYAQAEHPQPLQERIKLWVATERIKGASSRELEEIKSFLQSIPYVKVARSTQFFDRLIRGNKHNGQFRVRLLNQLGDKEEIVASSTDELLRWLKRRLRYAWMVKRLANIENPHPDFRVTLKVTDNDRTDFFIGEQISFQITSDKDAYIMLISVDSQGTYHILFPNRYCKNNFIKANTIFSVPDKAMRAAYFKEHKTYFKFVLTPPPGEEMIKVIATDKPLRIEDLGIGDFDSLFNNRTGIAEISRGIAGTLIHSLSEHLNSGKVAWSEDRVIIRSYEPKI